MDTGRPCVLAISIAGNNAHPEAKPVCDAASIRKGQCDVATTARADVCGGPEAGVVVDEILVAAFLIELDIQILEFVFPAPAKVRPVARCRIVTADQTHRKSGCRNGEVLLREGHPAKTQLRVQSEPHLGGGWSRHATTPDFEGEDINSVWETGKIELAQQVVARLAGNALQARQSAFALGIAIGSQPSHQSVNVARSRSRQA